MSDTPKPSQKPKSPRRSAEAVAADYQQRADAARLRALRSSDQWQALNTAIVALGELDSMQMTSSVVLAAQELRTMLEQEIDALEGRSAPSKQGVALPPLEQA